MSGPIRQDLKTVVLHRKPTEKELRDKGLIAVEKKKQVVLNSQSSDVADFRKIENETISLPHSTVDLGQAIQSGRTAKKMSQSDLDKKCNFPANTVKNYESGKAIVKPSDITKMEHELGVKLPRPKAKKLEQ